MDPSLPRSTRLENIRMEPDGAHFDLDGRNVHLRREHAPESVAAFQSFYDGAYQDVADASARAAKPGLFTRLRSWLGRLFSEPSPVTPPVLAPVVPLPPPEKPAKPARAGHPSPQLDAVYGDPQGIHIQWSLPARPPADHSLERCYPVESELGRRLQDCYGHLAQMGYQIVGLNLQPMEAPGPRREGPAPTPERNTPVMAAASLRAAPEPEIKKAPEAKAPTWVVRLLPESPDQPGRALTAPFATAENIQPLAGPDRLIRALRTAADPQKPAGESLTCLRCTLAKTGLKVVAIGLGETREGEPARWEEISQWLERQPEAGAEEKRVRPAPTARPAGPDLELNI